MRIIHFSDIHLGLFPHSPSFLLDKRLFGTLNHWLLRRRKQNLEYLDRALAAMQALKPDWIVCTGDLGSVGSPEEFHHAVALLQPFRKLVDGRFLFVPGNHDVYVRNKACQQALKRAFHELNGGRWAADVSYALLQQEDVEFFLAMAAHPLPIWMSSGRLTHEMMDAFRDWSQAPRRSTAPRILLCHFPVRTRSGAPLDFRRRCYNAEGIVHALERHDIDCMLCGHIHRPFAWTPKNSDEKAPIQLCAGSLTLTGTFLALDYGNDKSDFSWKFHHLSPS